MTSGPPERIVVGGQVWAATGALAERLAAGEAGRAPGVLVWDERDVDNRWADHPDAFVVRDRWLRNRPAEHGAGGLGRRLADAELRAHLRRHRRADLVLVGHAALLTAPWLVGHEGTRVWLPTSDDVEPLAGGLLIPPVAEGGPHAIVTHDLWLSRRPGLADEPRHRWLPGLRWDGRPDVVPTKVIALGPPDRTNGIDLVGRALAHRAAELRAAGLHLRWLAPPGTAIADDEAADLAQAGVADLVAVEHHTDIDAAARRALADPATAAVVFCGRPGAVRLRELDLVRAFHDGVRALAFGDGPPADLALEAGWTVPSFGDVAAIADGLLATLRTPPAERLPGPVGLTALMAEVRSRG